MPTHNTYRYTLGLVVEGIGSSTSSSKGIAWAYGSGTTPAGTDYEWQAGALASIPESIDTTVNPLSGDLSVSAFDFELNNSDTVASNFLSQQTSTSYKLSAAVTTAATSLTVVNDAGTGVTTLAGTVIWVGDEAILIGTHSGAGVYASCTRGFFSTDAQAHQASTLVYTALPYHRFRQCRVIVFDRDLAASASNPRIVWRGFVDEIQTNDDATRVQLSCEEAITALSRAKINRRAVNLAESMHVELYQDRSGQTAVSLYGDGTHATMKSGDVDASEYCWVQVEDSLFNGIFSGSRDAYQVAGTAEWGSGDNSIEEVERAKKAYPVFVVDKQLNIRSDTRELTRPYHPIEIAMALLTSTYSTTANVGAQAWDALHGDWGANIPLSLFDLGSIQAAIESTPTLEIERLILGWDGEPVEVWQVVVDKLLKPYGFYWGTDTEGRLNINRFQLVGISEFTTASDVEALPTLAKWQAARSNGITSVTAEVGGTPFSDPDIVTVDTNSGQTKDSFRRGIFGEERVINLDYSTQIDDVAQRKYLIERVKFGFFAMPRLTIRVGDSLITSADYDMGSIVKITLDTRSPILPGPDGTRTSTTNVATFAGLIVGRQLNLESMTYTLTCLLTNYRVGKTARWRAPSAVQKSPTSDNGDGTWDVQIQTYEWDPDAATADISWLTVGDEVEWWDPDGARHTLADEPAEITALDSGTNTITVDASNLSTGTYPTGSILRLARYDDYSNSTVISGAGDNVYAYLAESSGLGSGNDDSHIYG